MNYGASFALVLLRLKAQYMLTPFILISSTRPGGKYITYIPRSRYITYT